MESDFSVPAPIREEGFVKLRGKCKYLELIVSSGIVLAFLMSTNVSAASTGTWIQGVPWYQQSNDWMCGPASLQMIFAYWGPYIDQREIGFAADCYPSWTGTNSSGMVRGGHFSDLSVIDVSNCKIEGYTGRGLGYAAFCYISDVFWLDGLKALIDQGYPIAVASYWGYESSGNSDTIPASTPIGHYRVVVGYDDKTSEVIVNDPWARDFKHQGDFQGTNSPQPGYDPDFKGIRFSYDYFQQLWSYNYTRPYTGIFVAPWFVHVDTTLSGAKTKVVASVTYPCPAPFDASQYQASGTTVTISLPSGVTLAKGENVVKSLGTLSASRTVQVSWDVTASVGTYAISVTAQGVVTGSYAGHPYADRIGGQGSALMTVAG